MTPANLRSPAPPLLVITPLLALLAACTPAEPPPAPEPLRASQRQLTDTPSNERDAEWSPDGQWIVFGSSAKGNEDLYLIPAAGGQIEPLTSGPADELYAEWSPEGSRILFTSNRGGGSENVWTIAPDGTNLRQVTQSSDEVANRRGHLAAWSHDGQSILFVSARGREHLGIWSIPAAGGTAIQLSPDTAADEQHPAPSPDGTEVAVAQGNFESGDIVVRNLSTGETRPLVANAGVDWAPDWSPDGRWIAFSS